MRRVSEHETLATIQMEDHWRALGIFDDGWPIAEVQRVADLFRATPHELAMSCAVPLKRMTAWLREGRVPPYVALQMLERQRFYESCVLKLKAQPVVPIDELLHT